MPLTGRRGTVRKLAQQSQQHQGHLLTGQATVRYEALDPDPAGVTRGVLGFLGLELRSCLGLVTFSPGGQGDRGRDPRVDPDRRRRRW